MTRRPMTVSALDALGRVRLSRSFFLREFLYSEVAALHGIPNIPDDPDLAVMVGRRLCEDLLEPLQATFGKVVVRSAYRSCAVNGFCNDQQRAGKAGYSCASNEANYAGHIRDRRDAQGFAGATACIVIPWFADRFAAGADWRAQTGGRRLAGADWRALAWWVHDHLPYSEMYFFPKRAAFNLTWHERPKRRIDSYVAPRGCLTRPGMEHHAGRHDAWYAGFPALAGVAGA